MTTNKKELMKKRAMVKSNNISAMIANVKMCWHQRRIRKKYGLSQGETLGI